MINSIDRRKLLALTSLMTLSQLIPAHAQDKAAPHSHEAMMRPVEGAPKIAMLIYPKMVALDLIGPMTVFKIMRFNIELVWKDRDPVSTDVDISVTPTKTFTECKDDFDVLFIPGGIMGTIDCMNDPEVIQFVAEKGERAKWVTSVCTGGLVLGAAGLLNGYDATAHWAIADLLPLMGARHVNKRVVWDRNRVTGGGVTAGIDFALELAAKISDEETARRVQLTIEYAPQPPFTSGTPEEAGPELLGMTRERRKGMDALAREAAENAAKRLGI